ncbi:MAG: acetyl-CoA carboxylase biotin carboxyl carrier protein, partial [Planctomycetota bacterium]|nr:acetyl-CoA carboxylase biotin carboxyl carrier protein [Planctomycetota bacterium]
DLDRIRRLIELMKEHDLSEIDLRESEQRIRLARGGLAGGVPQLMSPLPVTPASAAPLSPPPAPSTAASPEAPEANYVYIKSPMVGTFYSRPNPNSEQFVKVGDYVDETKLVCIVEAMKVFNEIPAEVRGRIVATLVSDEDSVDFGKPLFKVDTSN